MKNKIKQWQLMLFSFLTIIFAAIISIFTLKATTITPDEPTEETANWDLDIVFYDSSVDNGTTPLTKIDWDATNNSISTGTPRVITTQITYRNIGALEPYLAKEITIEIDNILNIATQNNLSYSNLLITANYGNNTGYEWTLTSGTTASKLIFRNEKEFEAESNFEGTIQISYTLTPASKSPTQYESESEVKLEKEIKAELYSNKEEKTKLTESNILNFNYYRYFSHPWQRKTYTITKTATKLTAMDGLPADASNYIWVKYSFRISSNISSNTYPYITAKTEARDIVPDGVKVLDSNLQELIIEDNILKFSSTNTSYYWGYPIDTYNEEAGNLNITNHVDLYATYYDDKIEIKADDADVSINLNNFIFSYPIGEIYSFSKQSAVAKPYNMETAQDVIPYQSIQYNDGGNKVYWYLYFTTKYMGYPYTLRIGDDLVYATNKENNIEKASDNDYYFSSINFPYLYNGNNKLIDKKYDTTLYVRYANTTEYVQYGETFKNTNKYFSFSLEEKIVSFYFEINDLNEGIINKDYKTRISATMYYINKDILESGTIYNLGYFNIYTKNEDNSLNLINEPDITSYNNTFTKDNIAQFDLETYGHYNHRSSSYENWAYYTMLAHSSYQKVSKAKEETYLDAQKEKFTGSFTIENEINGYYDASISDKIFYEQLKENSFHEKITLYDLLPRGLKITSTKEEILETMILWCPYLYDTGKTSSIFIKNKGPLEISKNEFYDLFKERTQITIIKDWKGTGRDYLKIIINFEDMPITVKGTQRLADSGAVGSSILNVKYSYDYELTFDNYLEYGKTYINTVYCDVSGNSTYGDVLDAEDINENNDVQDKLRKASAIVTFDKAVATHQDVQAQVQTTDYSFRTGTVESPYTDNYYYKLRIRTGQNDVTNAVLINNIEQAFGKNNYWQGEFTGIDTTYIESKIFKIYKPTDSNADENGYIEERIKVIPYYSENPNETNLYQTEIKNNNGVQQEIFLKDDNGNISKNTNWKPYYENDKYTLKKETITITSPNYPNNYPAYMSESKNYWIIDEPNAEKIEVKFSSDTILNDPFNDYISIYDKNGKLLYRSEGTDSTAGKILIFNENYLKITMVSNSYYQAKGFSAEITKHIKDTFIEPATDKTKVKSLAFEFINAETGEPAIIPANSLLYVLVEMKAPTDPYLNQNILEEDRPLVLDVSTLAYNKCWTQWNPIDRSLNTIVDFVTGINSNTVRVALPYSVYTDEVPSISLKFTKEIIGTDEAFENLLLSKLNSQVFKITLTSLTSNDDGTYNKVSGLLFSNTELIITQIPIGTYLLTESDDNYFDFVDFADNNDSEIIIEGITFEKTDQGYIITIDENLSETIEFNIKVTNQIEPERYYEDKEYKENLILKNKLNT